jgi:hypothetical protein
MEAHRVVRGRGSHIFQTIGSKMAVRLSALCAGRPLHPGRFLVLISVKGWVDPQAYSAAERIRSIEKSNDLIANQTRDHPASSIVPQPTTLPRAPMRLSAQRISIKFCISVYAKICWGKQTVVCICALWSRSAVCFPATGLYLRQMDIPVEANMWGKKKQQKILRNFTYSIGVHFCTSFVKKAKLVTM